MAYRIIGGMKKKDLGGASRNVPKFTPQHWAIYMAATPTLIKKLPVKLGSYYHSKLAPRLHHVCYDLHQ